MSAPVLDPTSPGVSPAQTLALANQLRPLILHLARHLRRELRGIPITAGQAEILGLIGRRPGVGVNELASLEGISAPSMSSAVDKLEAAGLVVRVRGTGGDRRRVDVGLTAEGSRVLRLARSSRTAWLAERLRRLSPEQAETLQSAIGPLTELVEGPPR